MEKLISDFQKTPLPTKLAVLLVIIVGMCAGNYFMLIEDIENRIVALKSEQQTLDSDYTQKQTIANNLNEFKRQKEQLEQQLAQAITELPNAAEIDELLRQLNDVGKKAGLSITSVTPGREAPESFFVRIPIGMAVQGSYEEIALFFENVSRLRRIVNISNVNLGGSTRKAEKVVLNATFSATTFRFAQPATAKAN